MPAQNPAHLNSKLTGLTDLPHPHQIECECGRLARYALPVLIQAAQTQYRRPGHYLYTTLQLCGPCLALKMRARRNNPLKSDKPQRREI